MKEKMYDTTIDASHLSPGEAGERITSLTANGKTLLILCQEWQFGAMQSLISVSVTNPNAGVVHIQAVTAGSEKAVTQAPSIDVEEAWDNEASFVPSPAPVVPSPANKVESPVESVQAAQVIEDAIAATIDAPSPVLEYVGKAPITETVYSVFMVNHPISLNKLTIRVPPEGREKTLAPARSGGSAVQRLDVADITRLIDGI